MLDHVLRKSSPVSPKVSPGPRVSTCGYNGSVMCAGVSVGVCVREKDGQRERDSVCVCLCVCVCMPEGTDLVLFAAAALADDVHDAWGHSKAVYQGRPGTMCVCVFETRKR